MIDSITRQILEELQTDGRISFRELGERVGLSAPAVTDRVRRLEQEGIITGYVATVNPAALGSPILAIIRVHSAGPQAAEVDAVAESLPEVIECNRVSGGESHVLRAWLRDVGHLGELVEHFWEYGDTITNIVTSTPVKRRHIRLTND